MNNVPYRRPTHVCINRVFVSLSLSLSHHTDGIVLTHKDSSHASVTRTFS